MVFSLETRHDMQEVFFLEDSDWLQTSPSGDHWRRQQLFRYHWDLWTASCYSSMTPVNVTHFHCDCSPPVLQRVLPHVCVCVWNSHCGLHTEWLFETLLMEKQWRFWMNWKMRWGLSFILHWDPPFIAVTFACLGFRPSRQWPLFFFFCSNILSCNSFRSLKPWVFMFAERAKCFAGLQRIYVWTCRSEVDSRRMLSSIEMWEARNMFRQFYGLSECPLWDRIRGFSRLMQTLFWYYSTEGLGLLHVLVCIY